jgi:CubicO group peptidase (beta-lactamase class C family)
LTITQILTHTSGLGEAGGPAAQKAKTLADLVPLWLAAPMQYEPGEKWKYTQSGINAAGRIVEVISGMTFDAFLQKRLFDPLGMKDTTFYPSEEQRAAWRRPMQRTRTAARSSQCRRGPTSARGIVRLKEMAALYSTARDYAKFCPDAPQRRKSRWSPLSHGRGAQVPQHTANRRSPDGLFQNEIFGKYGTNYGWGIGTCVLRTPARGRRVHVIGRQLGHGGAWGTQAWVDPVKGVAYVLMVQRANFPNSDASDVRRAFQQAAAEPLGKR